MRKSMQTTGQPWQPGQDVPLVRVMRGIAQQRPQQPMQQPMRPMMGMLARGIMQHPMRPEDMERMRAMNASRVEGGY